MSSIVQVPATGDAPRTSLCDAATDSQLHGTTTPSQSAGRPTGAQTLCEQAFDDPVTVARRQEATDTEAGLSAASALAKDAPMGAGSAWAPGLGSVAAGASARGASACGGDSHKHLAPSSSPRGSAAVLPVRTPDAATRRPGARHDSLSNEGASSAAPAATPPQLRDAVPPAKPQGSLTPAQPGYAAAASCIARASLS